MSLLDVLRSAVKVANSVTKPIQATVTYRRCIHIDHQGVKELADPLPLHAIVDLKARQVRTRDGTLTVTHAVVDLIDVAEVIAATYGRGISTDDEFTLPDGGKTPTLDIGGFIDAGTTKPLATQVMLG